MSCGDAWQVALEVQTHFTVSVSDRFCSFRHASLSLDLSVCLKAGST